jgi:hypothetical protein
MAIATREAAGPVQNRCLSRLSGVFYLDTHSLNSTKIPAVWTCSAMVEQNSCRGCPDWTLHLTPVDLCLNRVEMTRIPKSYCCKALSYQSCKTGTLESRGLWSSYSIRGNIEASKVGLNKELPSFRTSQNAKPVVERVLSNYSQHQGSSSRRLVLSRSRHRPS